MDFNEPDAHDTNVPRIPSPPSKPEKRPRPCVWARHRELWYLRVTMPTKPRTAGKRLRALREGLGLSLSEVERLTRELAAVRRNPRLRVTKSRLCEIEAARRTPSIHCLFALAQAYRCDVRKLMGFYGLKA